MKPIKQLLRRPIRTIAALILLTVSASFMCLGWGVLQSGRTTAEQIDNSFVTLAMINPATKIYPITEYDEYSGFYIVKGEKFADFDATPTDVIDALASSSAFKGGYHIYSRNGYNPIIRSVTSASSDNRYHSSNDYPYNRAVAVIRVTEVLDEDPSDNGNFFGVVVTGDVIEFLALHPDYEPRQTVKAWFVYNSEEELQNASVEVGKTYIIYSENYEDDDLGLRLHMLLGYYSYLSPWIIDFDKLSYDLSDLPPEFADGKVTKEALDGSMITEPYVAIYVDEDIDFTCFMTQSYLDCIGRCGMMASGNICTEINGSLEDFLADPANSKWVERINRAENQYHTVDVLGTDLLDSIYLFHEKTAFVSEGRSFEAADYEKGNKVCLISESVAYASGLSVGDKIELDMYDGSIEYEIIGLYRHTDQWNGSGGMYDRSSLDITPNAVYVPSASLEGINAFTMDYGKYFSMVLKNGSIDDAKELIAEKGWPEDLLLYFDSGYSEIEGTVVSLRESANELFAASAATFFVVLIAYIALFVISQRRNAGLMLSLGSGKRRAAGFVLATSMIPAALSSIIGAIVGALLLNRTVNSVFNDVSEVLDTAFSSTASTGHAEFQAKVTVLPSSIIAACAILIVIYLIVLAIVSLVISHKKPLSLIKK